MTTLSFHLDKLSVGAQHVDTQEMFTPHKKRVESYLSNIFHEQVKNPPQGKTSLRLQFSRPKATLQVGAQEIALPKGRDLKRVRRVVSYYQNTGSLSKERFSGKEAIDAEAKTKSSVDELRKAAVPGSNGSILAGMRLADDSLALTRSIISAIPDIGPKDPVINHLGYYAGSFWTFFALRELNEGVVEYKRSKAIGDSEGVRRSEARLLSGSTVSVGSGLFLGAKFCESYGTASAATAVFNASNFLFGVGSIVSIGVSLLGAVRCQRFNSRLDAYLENPKLSPEMRYRGALEFLKDSLSVTPEESHEMRSQIEEEHPDWAPEKKEELFQQKFADLTETKVKYMKRRTSNKSIFLISSQADAILAKLSNKETLSEGIKEAAILINTVQQQNKLKMSLYSLGLFAAVLSFLGMLLACFMSAGIVPFVLYGISGTIYLALTIYSIAGSVLNKKPQRVSTSPHFVAPSQDGKEIEAQ